VSLDRELRTTFNDVAEIYDEVRPGYPEQLIEDAISLSVIPSGGSILEIGCGTGKATLPFARCGYAMLCLELSKNMASLAAEHCRPYTRIDIQNISFEEWPLQKKAFDLAICAEAFHWISPDIRLVKTVASLKTGGSIALFWHGHHGGNSGFFQAADEIYRERAPQLIEMKSTPSEELQRQTVEEVEGSDLFGKVVVRRYPWREMYTAERYVKLLSTYSPIQRLAENVRQSVLADIRELIGRHGGVVESEYTSRLYVARVRR
jgi:SAM-dependent methyltransferase